MSKAKVRPAVAADIDAVCRLLHEQMNRRLPPERWRRITTYGWLAQKPDFGRVVDDGGKVVGFVGSVYADREIAGRRERVVSMSSWYLDKAYRGQGLGFELMRSATEDDEASYTMITVSPDRRRRRCPTIISSAAVSPRKRAPAFHLEGSK